MRMNASTLGRVAILIPALNEELAIRRVVEAALAVLPDVIVIDDGSTDGTLQEIGDLPVTVIRHATPKGKGESLRDGFREALRRGFDAVVAMDGDGQHEPPTSRACASLRAATRIADRRRMRSRW
jgi:glycosyltransferase involved in cell wall biosynthesis